MSSWYVLIVAMELANGSWETPARSAAFADLTVCKQVTAEVKARYSKDKRYKQVVTGCNPVWFVDDKKARADGAYQ